MGQNTGLVILSGSSSSHLATLVAEHLSIECCSVKQQRFSDGELFLQIENSVRGQDVFVIQSTSCPANETLMELLMILDTLKRSSAGRITAVVPYFGYARQDRKTSSRVPITSKLVANLIVEAGAQRVITMDLHSGQIQGFFDIPTDNIYVLPTLAKHLIQHNRFDSNTVVVSPDIGGVARARNFAEMINAPLVIIDKRRSGPNEAEVMNIIGDVERKDCVIVDDMIDTAGTLCNGVEALQEHGALSVMAVCAHGVLSGLAIVRIIESKLTKVFLSDTITQPQNVIDYPKFEIISIAPLLGEVIRRIHNGETLNPIFH